MKQPRAQRQWQTDPGVWSQLRPAARDNRGKSTPAEAHLWQALRNRRLAGAKFRRQHAVGRFLVDIYCAEAALVVEIDGPVHQFQSPEDEARQAELEARGLKVLRFTNNEVLQDLPGVTARIEAHLTPGPSPTSERGTQPGRARISQEGLVRFDGR